ISDIYTLSLHDALPILALRHPLDTDRVLPGLLLPGRSLAPAQAGRPLASAAHGLLARGPGDAVLRDQRGALRVRQVPVQHAHARSEEHTSELQSRENLV